MTAYVAPWPLAQEDERVGFGEMAAFAAGVLVLLIFSEGWIVPIFGDKVGPDQGGLIRAAYFPAYAAGLFLLAGASLDSLRATIRQPFLILLILLAISSYFWSISPGETVRRVVALMLTTASGIALAARFKWSRLAEVFATAYGILTVASLIVSVALPHIGRMAPGSEFPGAWRGLWEEKNALGGNMALFFPAFAAAAIFNPKRRKLWWGAACLCVLMLLASTSKTALLALMLGIGGVVLVAMIRLGSAMAVITSWLAVMAVCTIGGVIFFAKNEVLALLGKDATLTGRTEIWKAVLIEIQHKPWLGHGYGTVWTDESRGGPLAWIVKHAKFRPHHSHNSWLEQWLWLGIAGLSAWCMLYLQTMVTGIIAVFRDKGAFLAFPFLLVYSMISLTESVTMTYNDLRWVVFCAVAVKLAFPDPPPEPVRNWG